MIFFLSIHLLIKNILINGDKMSINAQDENGETSLHLAVRSNNIDEIRTLIDQGIDLELKDVEGRTALDLAVLQENIECIRILLDHKADPNTINCFGSSPLYFAICLENIQITKLLLQYGADPHYIKDGRSMLYIATRNNFKDGVQILLDYGVNPFIKDPNGLTAKEFAKKCSRNEEIANLIESYECPMIKEPVSE